MAKIAETVFHLSKPISTHDGEVSKLELKLPTARSFIKAGVPYSTVSERADDGTVRDEFRFNTKAMFSFLTDMTGYDDIVLASIPAVDVMPLFYTMVAMLGERKPLAA